MSEHLSMLTNSDEKIFEKEIILKIFSTDAQICRPKPGGKESWSPSGDNMTIKKKKKKKKKKGQCNHDRIICKLTKQSMSSAQ